MTPPRAREVQPLISRRLLCRIGLHAWRPLPYAFRPMVMRCERCGREGFIA